MFFKCVVLKILPILFLVRGTFSSSANQTRSGVSAGIHRGKQLFGRGGAFGFAFWFGLTTASKWGSIDLAVKIPFCHI